MKPYLSDFPETENLVMIKGDYNKQKTPTLKLDSKTPEVHTETHHFCRLQNKKLF